MSDEAANGRRAVVIHGGRVLDPAIGLDRVTDLVIENGRISAIGDAADVEGTRVDAHGCTVVPGLIDSHVHCYGGVGPFSPDSIEVLAGVTTLIDAGGPGSATIDDFAAVTTGSRTTVHANLYVHAGGIGIDGYLVGDRAYRKSLSPRDLLTIRIGDTLRAIETHPEIVTALKAGAFPELGPEWVTVVKEIARWGGVPGYFHIGNFREHTDVTIRTGEMFARLDPGDTVTHIYTGMLGSILDDEGRVAPEVLDAADRGVHFDIGFGTTGFSFDVARRAIDQGVMPFTISSDLQLGAPRKGHNDLLGVMSALRCLGFTLEEMIPMVTSNPVVAFGLDGIGTLQVGGVADVTVIDEEAGEFSFTDTVRETVVGSVRYRARATVKHGELIAPDPEAQTAPENRRFAVSKELPIPRLVLSDDAADLLEAVADALEATPSWDPEGLHHAVHALIRASGLSLRDGLGLIYNAFMDRTSGPQMGWWLARLVHDGTLDVPGQLRHAAAWQRAS